MHPKNLVCLRHWLKTYHKRHPKLKTIAELEEVMQVIWYRLPQGPIDKAVKEFSKRLRPVLQLRVDILNIHSNCNVMTLLLLLGRCYFTL